MERRNTIQKELILEAVRGLKRHLTADEVYEYITKEHPTIGKGTVYRNLNILAEEGAIRKIEVPDGPDCFDFTLKNHYHVKCLKCGKVYDVDMDVLPDLLDKIHDTHGMQFIAYDIFFKGICASCREPVEKTK
jgi:Fur family transcriptional regulator, ferric uptake regulator